MKVGEAVCGVQNKTGKEDIMANKVENRISYAAAYALLKKICRAKCYRAR